MHRVWRFFRKGVRQPGGIVRYPLDRLHQEVAYIAYHFHWAADEIMEMPHRERHRWAKEIGEINNRINKSFGS